MYSTMAKVCLLCVCFVCVCVCAIVVTETYSVFVLAYFVSFVYVCVECCAVGSCNDCCSKHFCADGMFVYKMRCWLRKYKQECFVLPISNTSKKHIYLLSHIHEHPHTHTHPHCKISNCYLVIPWSHSPEHRYCNNCEENHHHKPIPKTVVRPHHGHRVVAIHIHKVHSVHGAEESAWQHPGCQDSQNKQGFVQALVLVCFVLSHELGTAVVASFNVFNNDSDVVSNIANEPRLLDADVGLVNNAAAVDASVWSSVCIVFLCCVLCGLKRFGKPDDRSNGSNQFADDHEILPHKCKGVDVSFAC